MSEGNRPYRTKVRVGLGSVFNASQQFTMAYQPHVTMNETIETDQNGNIVRMTQLGGVKAGSFGEIVGPALRAPRSLLVDYQKTASMGIDYVEMVPVELTEYKRVAWFPIHLIRVVG